MDKEAFCFRQHSPNSFLTPHYLEDSTASPDTTSGDASSSDFSSVPFSRGRLNGWRSGDTGRHCEATEVKSASPLGARVAGNGFPVNVYSADQTTSSPRERLTSPTREAALAAVLGQQRNASSLCAPSRSTTAVRTTTAPVASNGVASSAQAVRGESRARGARATSPVQTSVPSSFGRTNGSPLRRPSSPGNSGSFPPKPKRFPSFSQLPNQPQPPSPQQQPQSQQQQQQRHQQHAEVADCHVERPPVSAKEFHAISQQNALLKQQLAESRSAHAVTETSLREERTRAAADREKINRLAARIGQLESANGAKHRVWEENRCLRDEIEAQKAHLQEMQNLLEHPRDICSASTTGESSTSASSACQDQLLHENARLRQELEHCRAILAKLTAEMTDTSPGMEAMIAEWRHDWQTRREGPATVVVANSGHSGGRLSASGQGYHGGGGGVGGNTRSPPIAQQVSPCSVRSLRPTTKPKSPPRLSHGFRKDNSKPRPVGVAVAAAFE
eukprot:TRINITY_DN524_c0_g1_i2.p1 TRINITY_DN524_c0_g1~~TRINITY_DN524_c0_g1_i2.p1  ORF type:complete len:502 (-),score=80.58 TRINITY_DN524_c0_g1_i2:93-1598(-)